MGHLRRTDVLTELAKPAVWLRQRAIQLDSVPQEIELLHPTSMARMKKLSPHSPESSLLFVLISVFGLVVCGRLSAQNYTITELPPLAGHTYSGAYALNENSQAAGRSEGRAVIWTAGIPSDIQTLAEASSSVAYALNDSGQAAGDVSPAFPGNSGAFFWNNISMQRILPPAGDYISEAYAMNNTGVVVGTGGLASFGYRWHAGVFQSLGTLPGGNTARPYAINGFGQIVGSLQGSSGRRPVTWIFTSAQLVGVPPDGTGQGQAWGINDLGVVVGEFNTSTGKKPFLWSSSLGAQALPLPAGTSTGLAWAINDAGTIIGEANGQATVWRKNSSGSYEAKLLDPLITNATGWSGLSLYAINEKGQIAGDGQLNGEMRGFMIEPKPALDLSLRTDADRSGTTDFDSPGDATVPGRPFYFWTNDDHDDSGTELADGPTDSADLFISAFRQPRDLEDFARLALNLPPELHIALESGATLTLEAEGTGQIHLFPASSAGNETAYLTDETAANSQLADATNVALSGNRSNDGLTSTWENIQSRISPTDWSNGRLRFLWEGVTPGACILTLKLIQPDGTEIVSDPVHLSLRPVRDFFEHVRATPENGFPPPYETNGVVPTMSREVVHSQRVTPFDQQNTDLVWVHGWRLTEYERQNWAEMMFKRLWHGGYRGRLHAFTWPTLSGDDPLFESGPDGKLSFDRSEFRAWKSGAALDGYLRALRHTHSDARLALIAHSMGNIVTGEALRRGAPTDLQIMMQAAVSAGCYDTRAVLEDPRLLEKESKKPTPDFDVELGYRGFLSHVTVPTINYYNEEDFALQTGQVIGFINASWITNQGTKPDNPTGKGAYEYRAGIPGLYSGKTRLREVIDVHESLAFLARSRAVAVGAQSLTNFTSTGHPLGCFINRMNLHAAPFTFTDDSSEHSAQFNRPIQRRLIEFYTAIADTVAPAPVP